VTGPAAAVPPVPPGEPANQHGPTHAAVRRLAYQSPPGWFYQPPARPQQPPLDRWFSSEQAIGLAASVLIVVVAVMSWLTAWTGWNSYQVLKTYETGPIKDPDKLDQADLISGSLGIVAAVALLASAIVFIVWLWRVRWNAEMFCRGEHRFTRGWVLGSWICPVVNLWYPKRVVDDIVAASDPRTPPQTLDLRTVPGTPLVWAWWSTWVVGLVLDNVAQRSVLDGAPQVGELFTNAVMSSVSAASTTAAAVLAILIIQRVNEFQTQRAWTPWWAQGPAQQRQNGAFGPGPL
jgi:hypothetical protein